MLANMRRDYGRGYLELSQLAPSPHEQFRRWFAEAQQFESGEANAMTLATSSPEGIPSARIVLLKGADEEGFRFFTCFESRKADELTANPHAALVFYWPNLERQVRVEGVVERLDPGASESYFRSRPKGSQIGAMLSPQSTVIDDREELDRQFDADLERYASEPVPYRPDFWGGYIVKPVRFEFWQGRRSRLHDRFRYRRNGDAWIVERLAP